MVKYLMVRVWHEKNRLQKHILQEKEHWEITSLLCASRQIQVNQSLDRLPWDLLEFNYWASKDVRSTKIRVPKNGEDDGEEQKCSYDHALIFSKLGVFGLDSL